MKKVSFFERFGHAIGYEFFAILLCSPLVAWMMDKPLHTAGALTVTMSLIAMIWNMLYNAGIDRWVSTPRINWSAKARFLHGLGFEATLIVWCLPVAAIMLDISIWQAFMVELGFFVFILPYTIIYNWLFDKLMHALNQRRHATA